MSPPKGRMASANLSSVMELTTMNTAASSFWVRRLRTRSWKSSSTPRFTKKPVSAPSPAPMAAPQKGMRKMSPNSMPQNRPHTVELPMGWPGVTTSNLSLSRRATTATDWRFTMKSLPRFSTSW